MSLTNGVKWGHVALLLVVLLAAIGMAACIRSGSPVSVSGGEFVTVSGGETHTCGVRTDGSLACWGRNNEGQASPPRGKFASVGAGKWHTLWG